MSDLVFSPSSLKTFVQCPYKFKAMQIDKSVKWVQSPAAKRGEELHALMENACNNGWDTITWTDEASREHAYKFVQTIESMKQDGWRIYTEQGIGTDGYGHALDFWDKAPNNFLRCRIDLYATHPKYDTVMIFDWKSGKSYDVDDLQLQVNAACLQTLCHINHYITAFCYLDSGDVRSQEINVQGLNIRETDPIKFVNSPCLEMMNAINGAQQAIATGKFLKTKNRFCKWCQVKECMYAGK